MSIRKRTWLSPDGTAKSAWQADYRDQSGKRIRETFATKKEADAFLHKARGEVGAGIHTTNGASITVADAGARWIARCEERGLEATTVNAYRQHLALHIVPNLGTTKLSALTAPMVPAFTDKLRKSGCSPAMVRKSRIALGALLKFAQIRGLVAQNVVKSIGRDEERPTNRTGLAHVARVGSEIPTPDEIRSILAKLPGTRYRALLTTAVFTGLRASELRGLRWSDIDLKRGEIHVRQRADRFGKMGSPKSKAGRRTIPLMPMVVNTLKEHRLATKAISAKTDLDLVFPNRKGKIDHLVTIAAGWQAAQVAAGVVWFKGGAAKYPGLHALRHFYASWCINRTADGGLGLSPQIVQQRMGHATITMTIDVYGHLFPTADHSAEMTEAERRWHA